MRFLTRIWVAILPAYESRVIPWPGWDDEEQPPQSWAIDDWRMKALVPLQPGVRGIVAERRIPRVERVVRWLGAQIHDAPHDAPRPESDTDDEPEPDADDALRLRSTDGDRHAHRPPGV